VGPLQCSHACPRKLPDRRYTLPRPAFTRCSFISYRHVEPDRGLANRLAAALEHHGHQVFLDSKTPPGTVWGDVIDRELAGCNYLIAVVSEAAAAASPLVLTEISEAHRLNVAQGRPSIIPIRLGGEFRLRYPLSAYLTLSTHCVDGTGRHRKNHSTRPFGLRCSQAECCSGFTPVSIDSTRAPGVDRRRPRAIAV